MSIVEPEEYQEAEREFWHIHQGYSGGFKREEIEHWILFSLCVKELRQQSKLLTMLASKLGADTAEGQE